MRECTTQRHAAKLSVAVSQLDLFLSYRICRREEKLPKNHHKKNACHICAEAVVTVRRFRSRGDKVFVVA